MNDVFTLFNLIRAIFLSALFTSLLVLLSGVVYRMGVTQGRIEERDKKMDDEGI